MRTLVMTYHGVNINGNDYADNDHVALSTDLRLIHDLGLPIVSLSEAVDSMLNPESARFEHAVALSADDGAWFDWHDLPHPTCGMQRGLRGILADFVAETGATTHLTSFVIASPQARHDLDQRCLVGTGWWDDSWWAATTGDSLISLENHSWDHNHEAVSQRVRNEQPPGNFHSIADFASADAEIRQAADFLDQICAPHRCSLFAYPYGERNDYLARDYLPNHKAEHRMRAAFTTDPEPIGPGSDRWQLGRFVCGFHWRSPEALRSIIRDALGVA